jgi:hypothetical protein
MQLPNSTKWSVISLLFITAIPVSVLTYANHKAGTSNMVAVANASSGGEVTPTPQNNVVVSKSPELAVTITTPEPTKPAKLTTEQEEIIAFIKQTFGKDADEAIQIARCESGLRPNAVNHNTDSAQTIDYGLFQINNHWQEIDNTSFLFDYKINTLMAKKIFDNRGGNWSAWACATKLGL